MSLFGRSLNIQEKRLSGRLPFVSHMQSNGSYGSSPYMINNIEQQLNAYGAVGWIFAVVNRIAEGVAMNEWECYQKSKSGLPVRVIDHPYAQLWEDINPFYTRQEFIMASEQHYRLVGEIWWVLVTDEKTGLIKEIWPVRPDRMSPIRDDKNYLSGYMYRRAGIEIQLDIDDVVFIRNPSPIDDYRGQGVVQAILSDIEGEKFASMWARNFFINSAQPGGIIEYEDKLNDEEFQSIKMRWQENHQGISNAHQVAIIEGGHWVDAKYTQRDMQFIDQRKINRDTILGAFGVPMPILGITEAVNRANAEAGEYIFAKWIVKPSLERYKQAINYKIGRKFDSNVYLTFKDPVPPDPVVNLNSATIGYTSGLISQNEGRRRLGENPSSDGDKDVYGAPIKVVFPEVIDGSRTSPLKGTFNKVFSNTKSQPERDLSVIWYERLLSEASELISYLKVVNKEPDNKIFDSIAMKLLEDMGVKDGVSSIDIAYYNWDWESKYGSGVQNELELVFEKVFRDSLDYNLPIPSDAIIESLSQSYANHRMIDLLSAAGTMSIVSTTRERMDKLFTNNKSSSSTQIYGKILEDSAFSVQRAQLIAKSEMAYIIGMAKWKVAILQGQSEKRWIAMDESTSESCLKNTAMGWIPILDKFPSGEYTTPGHIGDCKCVLETRLQQENNSLIQRSEDDDKPRCKECGHRFNIRGLKGSAVVYCTYCKKEFEMS